ncbi:polysaccharide biosynthesis protein [Cecembia calidifontis]|uniref:Polysaccharide biosynthesis protein n=1 Tax=Cecembia calidifontis TaxID=1187080 RepID=A0A4Q7PDR8_9BACT|nr:polysaccharide biosynthesis protein [Cecembia calidifontis]RZS96962.1 polysaccharide biosynthesis protein [Cecembia calidifontis]
MTVQNIFNEIWKLSNFYQEPKAYSKLVDLTQELIKIYDQQGRIETNPFEPAKHRTLEIPKDKINQELKNRVCLITGGIGAVGNRLFEDLILFDLKEIILLDKRIEKNSVEYIQRKKIIKVNCDIRNKKKLEKIFKELQPEIVFHTAAVRDPGYAELHIQETIQTNILGTWNLVNICEKTLSVQKFIFSSTGKASRYITEEVYAASKKICEHILDTFARVGRVKYGMVRFTHIFCNSLMNKELEEFAKSGSALKIHSPGKFVTAQNLREASYLMLSALLHLESKRSKFLIVRNLEWPVESLEIALYYIKSYQREVPVVFCGNPCGYKEKFFRGQLDWNNPCELNLLINVYENQKREINEVGDIIISSICPISYRLLIKTINCIQSTHDKNSAKLVLINSIREFFKESLLEVDKKDTVNILKWGISPQFLEAEKTKISDYGHLVPILTESLKGTDYYKKIENLIEGQFAGTTLKTSN